MKNGRHPQTEPFGDLVPAGTGHYHLELHLEVERLETRGALVEVSLDRPAPLRRQLPVEKVIQGSERLLAVTLSCQIVGVGL
jgi:hypothetical protein